MSKLGVWLIREILRSVAYLGLVLEGVQVQGAVLVLIRQTVGRPLHEERVGALHTRHDHLQVELLGYLLLVDESVKLINC